MSTFETDSVQTVSIVIGKITRRYVFSLYMRSLRNFKTVNKGRYESLHAYAWGYYPTSVHKVFLRVCILGSGTYSTTLSYYAHTSSGC